MGSGINNTTIYGQGFQLQPSTAYDYLIMQKASNYVGYINFTGNPNGTVPANPASLSHDPVAGNIYYKASGTGNTGWVLLGMGSGFISSWVNVTSGASPTVIVPNTGYVSNSTSQNITFNLPTTAIFGSVLEIVNNQASFNFTIAQATGQSVQFGAFSTTVGSGGSISSTSIGDDIQLLCVVANTTWIVIKSSGNITYV